MADLDARLDRILKLNEQQSKVRGRGSVTA
jgi:hypothetical protein